MGVKKISTGSSSFDNFLNGGYEKDIVTTIFGPAGSGKTCLCLLAAIAIGKEGKKVIFIDTEGGFSVLRLKQLTDSYEKVLKNILFLKPTTFQEQRNAFEKLKEVIKQNIGLVVVDSIAMLYRLELGKTEDVYDINRELGQQLSYLTQIARKKDIPILITNQVYSDFDNRDRVKMVGGDVLKYGSKCLIELQKLHKNKRKAVLRKHRSLADDNEYCFEIKEKGIEEFIPQ